MANPFVSNYNAVNGEALPRNQNYLTQNYRASNNPGWDSVLSFLQGQYQPDLSGNPGVLKRLYEYALEDASDASEFFVGGLANYADQANFNQEHSGVDTAIAGLEAMPLGSAYAGGVKKLIKNNPHAEQALLKAFGPRMQAAPGGQKLLSGPDIQHVKNSILREEKWGDLAKAHLSAGTKRNQKTGRYVGAGPGITSPQKKTAVVNKYMDRVNASLDADIPPGYFYAQGRDALEGVTDDTAAHMQLAEVLGPTSTQVGPKENLNYALRATDQTSMGTPVNVGLYPNSLRRSVQSGIHGEDPWTGYKVERYSKLLGPDNPHANPLANMPPNDQWEGLGTGLGGQKVPSGPTQVAFSDHIREQAMNRLNKKRAAEGKQLLNREEMQELHWAAIRAEIDGRPLVLNPGDTVQGSIPGQTFQHSWEAAPGVNSSHYPNMDVQEYSDAVKGVLVDEGGKDNLVRAMGGKYQSPVVDGPGVYKGDVAPGYQSRSLISQTKAHGLDPASEKRIDSTEAVRQYMLGQDGRAGHTLMEADKAAQVNAYSMDMGRPLDNNQAAQIDQLLTEKLGLDAGGNPNHAVVFSDNGYRVLNVGDIDNKSFDKVMNDIAPAINEITPGQGRSMRSEGIYGEYDWAGGNATTDMLNVVDDPMFPGAARLADSPETRQIAGDMTKLYGKLKESGMMPNEQLVNVLKTWSSEGLSGVRALVQKGLAPAFVLGVLSGQVEQQDGLAN